jgi:hypothetical protein
VQPVSQPNSRRRIEASGSEERSRGRHDLPSAAAEPRDKTVRPTECRRPNATPDCVLTPSALYQLAAPNPIEVHEEIERMIAAGEIVAKATRLPHVALLTIPPQCALMFPASHK